MKLSNIKHRTQNPSVDEEKRFPIACREVKQEIIFDFYRLNKFQSKFLHQGAEDDKLQSTKKLFLKRRKHFRIPYIHTYIKSWLSEIQSKNHFQLIKFVREKILHLIFSYKKHYQGGNEYLRVFAIDKRMKRWRLQQLHIKRKYQFELTHTKKE